MKHSSKITDYLKKNQDSKRKKFAQKLFYSNFEKQPVKKNQNKVGSIFVA